MVSGILVPEKCLCTYSLDKYNAVSTDYKRYDYGTDYETDYER